MTSRNPFRFGLVVAFLLVTAVALLAVGCGGSSSSDAAQSTTATTTSTTDSQTSFTDCLKEHGVDNFDPSQLGAGGSPPDSGDPAKLQSAMQACQGLAPQGGFGGDPQGGQSSAQFQKLQQCLKDNDVTGGLGSGPQGTPSAADQAKRQKAMQACGKLAPQGGPPQGAPGAGDGNFQAFARCMKRHGVELPGAGSTSARSVATTSAKDARAQKACASLLRATR